MRRGLGFSILTGWLFGCSAGATENADTSSRDTTGGGDTPSAVAGGGGVGGVGGARTATVADGGASTTTGSAGGGGAVVEPSPAAAMITAESAAACVAIKPFYWEIGDAMGALPDASGSPGGSVTADDVMNIASASKLVFGAYVVQRFQSTSTLVADAALTMRAGYTSMTYASCLLSLTVSACFGASDNDKVDPDAIGIFNYNAGHFQKLAVDIGLGSLTNGKLAEEMQAVLGADVPIAYSSPQLAGGMRGSASDYAIFLRKILAGELAIRDHLGDLRVDTYCPDPVSGHCYSPASSPLPNGDPAPIVEAWHYSYGHWVEDDTNAGPYDDGAFSSPGAFGFYPWIDATKTHYGIVARKGALTEFDASARSVECGRRIRRAFLTGVAEGQ